MTTEQNIRAADWYRRVGDGSVRLFLKNGGVEVGKATRLTQRGITLNGRRFQWADVEAAEGGSFA